jgi:hypothetical protein
LQRLVNSINRVLNEGEAVASTTPAPELSVIEIERSSNSASCWPRAAYEKISASARRFGAASPTAN